MTTLSVIIPTFNRALLVQQAVESVLQQLGDFRFEIIVVDDGSTPQTAEALRRFGSAIRYVRQENAGLNPARNHGLRLASAEYIALLDDDDVWLPFKTALLMKALQTFPRAGFVHSDFFIWKPDTNTRRPNGLASWFPEPFSWERMYEHRADIELEHAQALGVEDPVASAYVGDVHYWSLFAPMVLPSTAIFRRSALGSAKFPEVDSVGDWEFFARLSQRCGAVFVPRETTLNRSHEDAVRLTRVDPSLRLRRRLALIHRLWRSDSTFMHARAPDVDRVEASCLRQLARLAIANGDRHAARETLRTLRTIKRQGKASDALLWALAYLPLASTVVAMRRAIRHRSGISRAG
jgi:hypothetical protein